MARQCGCPVRLNLWMMCSKQTPLDIKIQIHFGSRGLPEPSFVVEEKPPPTPQLQKGKRQKPTGDAYAVEAAPSHPDYSTHVRRCSYTTYKLTAPAKWHGAGRAPCITKGTAHPTML